MLEAAQAAAGTAAEASLHVMCLWLLPQGLSLLAKGEHTLQGTQQTAAADRSTSLSSQLCWAEGLCRHMMQNMGQQLMAWCPAGAAAEAAAGPHQQANLQRI
jgi:hypothetical protein